MCRKFTGSLLPQNIGIPSKNVSPPFASNATYKLYKSSDFGSRGFCSECGSSLTFVERENPENTELCLGSLDEEILCGKRDEDNSWEDEHGKHVPRKGGIGRELCYTERHIFLDDAIPGITDDLPGKKWLTHSGEGEAIEGKVADCVQK